MLPLKPGYLGFRLRVCALGYRSIAKVYIGTYEQQHIFWVKGLHLQLPMEEMGLGFTSLKSRLCRVAVKELRSSYLIVT